MQRQKHQRYNKQIFKKNNMYARLGGSGGNWVRKKTDSFLIAA